MSYASWSVVFGEQPSAAKWNILGTNDASFNDGSGLPMTNMAVSQVATSETTTSTSYTDLSTVHSISVTVGSAGKLLIGYSAEKTSDNTSNAFTKMTLLMSGANTQAAVDDYAAEYQSYTANAEGHLSRVILFTGLAAGATTVKAQYKVVTGGGGAGTGTFQYRNLWAIPF